MIFSHFTLVAQKVLASKNLAPITFSSDSESGALKIAVVAMTGLASVDRKHVFLQRTESSIARLNKISFNEESNFLSGAPKRVI